MSLLVLTFILTILLAFSIIFNYLFLKWTMTLGTKDLAPAEELRWSASYKPAIGGISFYIIFLISFAIYLFFQNPDLSQAEESIHLGILVSVTIGFFTGLTDDACNTVPWLKLFAQITCGIVLLVFDLRISFFEHVLMDSLLTIFWTVAVMNSINMLDNMNAITSVVSIFILGSAAIIAQPMSDANIFYTFVCGGVIASLAGFLVFNWHPSRIFMGDTGSQMLGALLAAVGILFFWNNDNIVSDHSWYSKLVIVGTAFVIPIADSITVTVNRILRGQSPFLGGKDHTTHHLSYAGFNDRQVAWIMIAISIGSVALISALMHTEEESRSSVLIIESFYLFTIMTGLYSTTHWTKAKNRFNEINAKN